MPGEHRSIAATVMITVTSTRIVMGIGSVKVVVIIKLDAVDEECRPSYAHIMVDGGGGRPDISPVARLDFLLFGDG